MEVEKDWQVVDKELLGGGEGLSGGNSCSGGGMPGSM